MPKTYVIKESTRQRCSVFIPTESQWKQFRPISLELFLYLKEARKIRFSIYIRIGKELIEYIKPKELSTELLQHIWLASQKVQADVDVYVKNQDFANFNHLIDQIRSRKVENLLARQPELDRKTLEVFQDLSGASQMVLRGGINHVVAKKVNTAAAFMVSNLINNEYALGTLSRMITIDPTLYDHSASVAMFAGIMAKQYLKSDLGTKQAEVIAQCGLYHDAGKSCIPHSVLNKPGSFTDDEYEIMKKHVFYGCDELEAAIDKGAPIDRIVARVAMEHHERMNGEGYPHHRCGRAEEDPENGIHLYSRIIAIADAYSALLMKRVYKPALPAEKAIELMSNKADDHFDMAIFNPFVDSLRTSLRRVNEDPVIQEEILFDEEHRIRVEPEQEQTGLVYILDGKKSLVQQIKQRQGVRENTPSRSSRQRDVPIQR